MLRTSQFCKWIVLTNNQTFPKNKLNYANLKLERIRISCLCKHLKLSHLFERIKIRFILSERCFVRITFCSKDILSEKCFVRIAFCSVRMLKFLWSKFYSLPVPYIVWTKVEEQLLLVRRRFHKWPPPPQKKGPIPEFKFQNTSKQFLKILYKSEEIQNF